MTDLMAAAPAKQTSPVVAAYTVGLREDNSYIFQSHGPDAGLIQLLGLHAFAGHQLKSLMDKVTGTGDAISHKSLKLLEALIKSLNAEQENVPGGEKPVV